MTLIQLSKRLLELSTDPRKHYQLNRFVFAYKMYEKKISDNCHQIGVKSINVYFENELVYSFKDCKVGIEATLYNMNIRDENLDVVLKEVNFIDVTDL